MLELLFEIGSHCISGWPKTHMYSRLDSNLWFPCLNPSSISLDILPCLTSNFILEIRVMGHQDDSVGKGSYCQTWRLELVLRIHMVHMVGGQNQLQPAAIWPTTHIHTFSKKEKRNRNQIPNSTLSIMSKLEIAMGFKNTKPLRFLINTIHHSNILQE